MTASWPLPPHVQLTDLLPEDELRALTQWTIANQDSFRPASIIADNSKGDNAVDRDFRIAVTSRDLGPMRQILERHLWAALPRLESAVATKTNATSLELELAAHGDGAHYRPHLDIPYGADRKSIGGEPGTDRVLSAVFYFHHEPKGFSGGKLRLFRFGARPLDGPVGDEDWCDVEPLQNSLVAFPSWALHEVRPIQCPSQAFEDYRFAINCWYCRKLDGKDALQGGD